MRISGRESTRDSALRLGAATRRCNSALSSGPRIGPAPSAMRLHCVLWRCDRQLPCGAAALRHAVALRSASRVCFRLSRLLASLASPCFFLANSACRRNFKGLGFWFRELCLRLWVQGLGFSPALGLEVCGKGCSAAAVL